MLTKWLKMDLLLLGDWVRAEGGGGYCFPQFESTGKYAL